MTFATASAANETGRLRLSGRSSLRLTSALALVALALEAASLVLLASNLGTAGIAQLGFNGVGGAVLGLTYPVVGWLIASRRPQNAIGWMFLLVGLSQAATGFASEYSYYGLMTQPGAVPLADLATWFGAWLWVPGFVPLFLMVLLFPDGHLPSRRWRPVLWLAGLATALMMVFQAIGSWGYRGLPLLMNTIDGHAATDTVLAVSMAVSNVGQFLMVAVGLASVAGMIVRFRRAGPVERPQIKWFAAAAMLEIGLLLLTTAWTLPHPVDLLLAAVVMPLVPAATAAAILRYRLYEIDRIVSRTISWALLTVVLGALFVAVIIGLQALLAPVTENNTLAVAVSTLIAAALFQPLRTRVQRAVDRRFNRSRVDAERAVGSFAAHARDQVDLGQLRGVVIATVHSTVSPLVAGVWLRDDA